MRLKSSKMKGLRMVRRRLRLQSLARMTTGLGKRTRRRRKRRQRKT
jgi:hypothetical protein